MKNTLLIILAWLSAMASIAQGLQTGELNSGMKPRVIVLTDGETDDRCSMVHFLLYTNDMQVDAIIQTNSCFQKRGWSHEPWLQRQIDAYAKVYPNLKVHDAAYPTPEYLRERIFVGDEDSTHVLFSGRECKMLLPGATPQQPPLPMRQHRAISPSQWPDTPGSDRIVEVLLEDDPRPVFIQCWGGMNTAAKAFYKLRHDYPQDYERAVQKAVLYCIWYQDAGGPYIEHEHPLATILLNHHFSGSWDYGTMTNTTDFVNRYLHNRRNYLGRCYTQPYISEGDTPAFLYSLDNGLRSYEDPTYGGWGGCFYKVPGYEHVYRDTGFGQLREWIEPAMHDFQARLQWCVAPKYEQANHKPVIEVPQPLDLTVYSGDTVRLFANVSDPDPVDVDVLWAIRGELWTQAGITRQQVQANPQRYSHQWRVAWYQYPAGTYSGNVDLMYMNEHDPQTWFVAPDVNEPKTIHVILEAYDMTTPRLTSYARYIITVKPRKPRVIISSDIGGTDPDDNQSMAHLLMYSDSFDLEGIISSPSFGDGNKAEIMRMIDVYEQDMPILSQHVSQLMTPAQLRPLVKQGRMSEAPPCGYGEPTEGSQWIVQQARKSDDRPLYVLVWGCLEDVAQALHDAPDIAPKLRVHWIGGPNKKWGVNAYCYIIENFPNLWMIENNTTYRGFIYDSRNHDQWNAGYFDTFIKDAGHLGRDFAAYYQGNPKMGDTPSLLYLMSGNPDDPTQLSWAGRFEPCRRTPRTVFHGATTAQDTAQICSIIEWQLQGPKRSDIAIDSACITLDIRRQQWKGYYKGNGLYLLRHSTYYTGTLDYTITSTINGFAPIQGQITIENTWDVKPKATDYIVGPQWWTDSYALADYWHNCAGAATQLQVRQQSIEDWAQRWAWLK